MPFDFARNRRWFRFSLRTMFVVVTVVAVVGCWLGRELLVIQERRDFVNRALTERHGLLEIPCGLGMSQIPEWRSWLGDTPQTFLVLPAHWSDAELDRARFLFPEALEISRESDLATDLL